MFVCDIISRFDSVYFHAAEGTKTSKTRHVFIIFSEAGVRTVRRWGGVQQQRERQSCCSAEEQMGETRQGRMNSGQKEGDSRA